MIWSWAKTSKRKWVYIYENVSACDRFSAMVNLCVLLQPAPRLVCQECSLLWESSSSNPRSVVMTLCQSVILCLGWWECSLSVSWEKLLSVKERPVVMTLSVCKAVPRVVRMFSVMGKVCQIKDRESWHCVSLSYYAKGGENVHCYGRAHRQTQGQ